MYGENGARLREGLTELLRQHRIQQRVPGRHWRTASDTAPDDERVEASRLIGIYRQAVLVWCHRTAVAIDPYVTSNVTHRPPTPFARAPRELAPLDSLTHALARTASSSSRPLPTLEQLTTPHPIALVETWRQVARAAALAEHDINAGPGTRPLTVAEALTVAGDIAAISQALVVLDRRYKDLPGWEPLRNASRLGWAALACALDAGLGAPDHSVDAQGWRPRAKPIRGAVRPGYLGVLQAEHNVLVTLGRAPSAMNLRRIADSQRLLSALLADRAELTDRAVADRWRVRAQTYQLLQRQLRDIGGLVGSAATAAGEAAAAVSRLRSTASGERLEPRVIGGFVTIFAHLDERIADLLEDGVADGRYIERTKLPVLADLATHLVHAPEERFVPVTVETRTKLRAIARHRLRPVAPSRGKDQPDGRLSRAEIQAALIHRPTPGHPPRLEI